MGKVYWDETRFKQADERLDVIALGDSWFWYPENNLLNPINKFSNEPNILCFGANGATSVELASGFYYASFLSALRGYTMVAAVLISAGGNDFAGFDDFQKILKTDCSACEEPSECFNTVALAALIDTIHQSYEKLIHAVLAIRPNAKILFHNYDYAIPTGKGFLGLGQWLKAPMDARGVPDPHDLTETSFRRSLIKLLIDELGKMQDALVMNFPASVIRVKTPGTLLDDEWANELHATVGGFDKLGSQRFAVLLGPIVLGSDLPDTSEQIMLASTSSKLPKKAVKKGRSTKRKESRV